MTNPLRLGIFSALQNVEEKRSARADRARQVQLQQDAMRQQAEDRKRKQMLEDLVTDRQMRDAGYVPDAERGPDAQLSGQSLDQIVGLGTGMSVVGMKGTEQRYGSSVGGYTYDRMNPKRQSQLLEERLKEAQAAKYEHDAREPYKTESGNEPMEVVIENGQRVYRPRSQAAGKPAPTPTNNEGLVQVVDPDGNTIFVRKSDAVGMAPGNKQGGQDRRKRLEALSNVTKALDAFESNLQTTGSKVVPSVAKDQLQTDYENLQLQLKELFNLGVLNGPDLQLMRRIVGDPTSVEGRLKAMGSGDEQSKRALAQVAKMREKIEGFRQSLEMASSAPTPHGITKKTLDPDSAAKAKADPAFAAWLRSQGYEVP